MDPNRIFAQRRTIEQVEEGHELAPKFDAQGLIAAVTTDFTSGELLMVGYMNAEALTPHHRDGRGPLFQPQPPGAVAQGRHERPRAEECANC